MIYGFFLLVNPSLKYKKIFCCLASLNWILLSGLRNVTIGADTIKYEYIFQQAKLISWNTLWNDFINIFIKGSYGKDPGYIVFQKLVQLFTSNYRIYLIMIAVIFIVPLGIWIYKNSIDPLMSFIIYSCLFYSFFSITGTRQTVATSIAVFIGYKFIKERRFWIFFILLLLAMPIHFSAICYLPFYFIANKKITNKYLTFAGCGMIIILIFKESIFYFASKVAGYEQYLPDEGAGTWTFTTFLIIILIAALIKKDKILLGNPQAIHYINALLVAVMLAPFTFVNSATMRVIQYFSLFIMLLVPEILNTFSKKEKNFVFLIAAATLILLLIRNDPSYMFFWQT